MKIVIVGPGAIGCLLAGLLYKSKEEIWVLDKNKDRAQILSRQGIRVEGEESNWLAKVNVTTDVKLIQKPDLIILCVKSYDTKQAATSIKDMVSGNTCVMSLQNGVGNLEIISEIIGEEKVMGGTIMAGATLLDVGRVRHAGGEQIVVGRLDGKLPVEMRQIREVFNKSGLGIRMSKDLKGLLWSKLVINVGINALAAITGLPNGKLVEFEGARRILRDAVTEAVKVAKRKRIKLIFDDPLAKVEAACEITGNNICSMLADVRAKKRTEIDFINAVIVRLGQELGIQTPVNTMLVDLVKTIEFSYSPAVNKKV